MRGCIKFIIAKLIKSVEKYKVVKRGRKYHDPAVPLKWKRREREAIPSFHIILRLLGRISSGEVDENFEEENKDFKNGSGEQYKLVGNFIHTRLEHHLMEEITGKTAGRLS